MQKKMYTILQTTLRMVCKVHTGCGGHYLKIFRQSTLTEIYTHHECVFYHIRAHFFKTTGAHAEKNVHNPSDHTPNGV